MEKVSYMACPGIDWTGVRLSVCHNREYNTTEIYQNSIADVVESVVCKVHNVTMFEIKSEIRERNTRIARQRAMYFLKEYTKYSLQKIADRVKRDHATVIHACRVVSNDADTDNDYRKDLNSLNIMIINDLIQRGLENHTREPLKPINNIVNGFNQF